MAAGCTLDEEHFDIFDAALQQVASEWLDASTLQRRLHTDGVLPLEYFNTDTVAALDAQVWGQAFEAPLFCDEVEVIHQRLVGEKHLKLRLRCQGQLRDGIWFQRTEPLPDRARLAYRITLNEWQGRKNVEMVVEAMGT
jgi:single-stranded-DNA-specific exonuclease